jgi:deazaflavin-dependent oxidoreductase (nitroreductase family)
VPHYKKPGWLSRHVLNGVVGLATSHGMSIWGSRMLRVRGRKTGQWRSVPVNVLQMGGERYLVAPRGETEWVKNLRARGSAELVLGRRAEQVTALELSDSDKTEVLRAYLKRWRVEVGVFFDGVTATSPASELDRIAPQHPVFRVVPVTN